MLLRFWSALKIRNASVNLLPAFNDCVVKQDRWYAARKGKRAKLLALKKERKLIEAAKPKPPKPHMLRKTRAGGELDRRRDRGDNWMTTNPVDNVWRTALYRGKPYTFSEVIAMHQEVCHPTILNEPDALLHATIELDLSMKKKEHYLSEFTGIVSYPNEFQTPKINNIIVICKTAEDQAKASEAGAVYVGSASLVKQIISGEIPTSEFDYVVCHPDMYKEVGSLRGILKKNFPSVHNGLVRLDVDKAVKSFMHGVKYTLKRSMVEPDYGWVKVCFGRIALPVTLLEDNLKHLFKSIEKHRPPGVQTPFITKTLISCDKSIEYFKLPHWDYLPGYEMC